jgi:hypothetical protein
VPFPGEGGAGAILRHNGTVIYAAVAFPFPSFLAEDIKLN